MKRTLLALVSTAAAALGQDVVSARAGMINYIEGAVAIDGKQVVMPDKEKMFTNFPEVKNGGLLTTGEGRAEMLLSPGVVLRLGENADLKMVDSSLSNTRVELSKGAAVIEVAELLKDNAVTIAVGDALVLPKKAGTYRISAGENADVMTYEGQAEVRVNGETKMAKRGNALPLTGTALVARKFDTERGDALTRWSLRRSSYVAMANVSSATYANKAGWAHTTSMWRWNPFFGMFTYLPYRGMACSAFSGYCFYSPRSVYRAFYVPPPSFGGNSDRGAMSRPTYTYDENRGYTVSSGRSYGGYGDVPAAPGAAAAPAPAPPSGGDAGGVRGGDVAGGRSSGGGGGNQ